MRLVAIVCLFAFSAIAFGQPSPEDPPAADRPVDFSNIVGNWAMRLEATPTEARVEEPITLRVLLIGDGPAKYAPSSKYLKLFPESFETDFYLQEMRDEHRVLPEAKTWLFVYRLKPKHEKIREIDGITLWYYNPNSPGNRKFIPIFAPPISITVGPKQTPKIDVEVKEIVLPKSYYVVPDSDAVIERGVPFTISGRDVALALGLPPVLCGLFVFGWRLCFPTGAARARWIRRHAARVAFLALHQPRAAIVQYLADRVDFEPRDPTPAEAGEFLRRRGCAATACSAVERFFTACDAGRFSGTPIGDRQHLVDLARQVIEVLEADPCLQS